MKVGTVTAGGMYGLEKCTNDVRRLCTIVTYDSELKYTTLPSALGFWNSIPS